MGQQQPGMAPGAMMPAGGAPMMGPMGGARGAHGPVGKTRNPVVTLLVSYVCFVYAFIQGYGMLSELKAFRQKDDLSLILFLIPIMNIIQVWKLPAKVLEAKQMAGVPNAQVPHPILYLLLGLYFLPVDLNEVWMAAGGGRP
jgi:hypothetical protein